jgi:CheY-like chemotaxis protein
MHDLSDWRVVIIDDEPDNIGVIDLVLSHYQAEVHQATSGFAGLQMLEMLTPTLILLDIQMPDISGFEVLPKLRQNPRLGHIPIIAVTAHAMSGDQERILEAGFDGYIPKPVNAMSLVDEILAIIAERKQS